MSRRMRFGVGFVALVAAAFSCDEGGGGPSDVGDAFDIAEEPWTALVGSS
jgi:hypothetical protein